ncbi:MAG TPA: hypothetical protein GXZ93_06830 [Actinobacteria bacterium]|nr:hypothetical protein [Actinomycetota bacterium]
MKKNKIPEFKPVNKKGYFLLKILGTLLLISLILLTGCVSVPKYTYEEYKKIKALEGKEGKESSENSMETDNGVSDDLEVFYKDLDAYNNFISEFTGIYSKYYNMLLPLFDNFDSEQEDFDKKTQYAKSIISIHRDWLEEIKEVSVPDIMNKYNGLFRKYLEKEILFYESILRNDIELTEKYQIEASEIYDNIEDELQRIKNNFNSKSSELNIEKPFAE